MWAFPLALSCGDCTLYSVPQREFLGSWPRGTWLLVAVLTTLPGLEISRYLISFHSVPTLALDSS